MTWGGAAWGERAWGGSPAAAGGGYTLTAATGTFTLTGNATGLIAARSLTADRAQFTLTGNATGLNVGRKLTADFAAFTLTGYDAGLTYSGGAAVLTAERGQFTLTGNATGLVAARKLTADAAALTLTGNAAALNYGKTLTAARGQFTLTGQDVAFGRTYVLTADPAAFTLTGRDAGLTYSGAPVVETTPTRRGTGGSRFVEARKRLPMPFLIDWLTNDEPTEETKRVITEIKAGRPIPRDIKPPKGPENISAERLARQILPNRAFVFENYLSELIDAQRVIEKAVQLAREQDDEDILLLL